MFEAVKPKTLSDADVEEYIKASETESVKADDLKGALKKEEVKSEEKKEEPKKEKELEEVVKKDNKTIQTFLEEDEKAILEAQQEEENSSEEGEGKQEEKKKPTKSNIKSAINFKDMVSVMIEDEGWQSTIIMDDGSKVDLTQVPEEEFTPEVYANLVKYQNSLKAQALIEEEKAKYGDDGLQLFEFLQKGGKLSQIAEYYQAAQDINSIDATNIDGALAVIEEYYERTGEDKDWIKDYTDALKERGEEAVLKEGKDRKSKLLAAVEEEKSEMIARQAEIDEQNKLAEKRYNAQVREAIHSNTTLSDREKRDAEKYAFDYQYPHPQNPNTKVNKFFLDFTVIQNDPKKFAKLQQIVKDFDKYEDKTKVKEEAIKSTHTFLRKNQASLTKPSSQELEYQSTKQVGEFDINKFNKLINKK